MVAHSDDESFGLGAVLAALVRAGTEVRVLCLTEGEASTLGATIELAARRAGELANASRCLGVSDVILRDLPDGALDALPPAALDLVIESEIGGAGTLVVFEPAGVTGHLDHRVATRAAGRVADAHGLAVLEWGVDPDVAIRLNAELGTTFAPFHGDGVVEVVLDRVAQRAAIACHESQLSDNPVVGRRLELEGDVQRVRFRRPEGAGPSAVTPGGGSSP